MVSSVGLQTNHSIRYAWNEIKIQDFVTFRERRPESQIVVKENVVRISHHQERVTDQLYIRSSSLNNMRLFSRIQKQKAETQINIRVRDYLISESAVTSEKEREETFYLKQSCSEEC